MRFAALGVIQVEAPRCRTISITAPKTLALLAYLLVNRDLVVPAERIGDALWTSKSARDQSTALRFHIWKLRAALEPGRRRRDEGTVVRTDGGGYGIDMTDHTFDVVDFETLLDSATNSLPGDPDVALGQLDSALGLWRGEPYSNVRNERFIEPDVRQLEALKVQAEILRFDSLLLLGRPSETIAPLEAVVTEHPLTERFWGQLMTALYLTGRQGDALATYHRACDTMERELGSFASVTLDRLYKRLRQPLERPMRPAEILSGVPT